MRKRLQTNSFIQYLFCRSLLLLLLMFLLSSWVHRLESGVCHTYHEMELCYSAGFYNAQFIYMICLQNVEMSRDIQGECSCKTQLSNTSFVSHPLLAEPIQFPRISIDFIVMS